jgi:large subunit ribosomal protein L29
MKARELRDLSDVELARKLDDLKEEMFNLRFRHAAGDLGNPMQLKKVKHDIARVKTLMRERELGLKRA